VRILLTEKRMGLKQSQITEVKFHLYAYTRLNMKVVTTPSDFRIYRTQILPTCVNSIRNVGFTASLEQSIRRTFTVDTSLVLTQ